MAEDVIWVVTDELPQVITSEGSRGDQGPRNPFDELETVEPTNRYRVPVKAEKLEQGITEFLQVIGRVIRRAQQSAGDLGGMELDEIELAVEVNGEGQLSLLGNGGKVGGKGAMTLKFKMTKF